MPRRRCRGALRQSWTNGCGRTPLPCLVMIDLGTVPGRPCRYGAVSIQPGPEVAVAKQGRISHKNDARIEVINHSVAPRFAAHALVEFSETGNSCEPSRKDRVEIGDPGYRKGQDPPGSSASWLLSPGPGFRWPWRKAGLA